MMKLQAAPGVGIVVAQRSLQSAWHDAAVIRILESQPSCSGNLAAHGMSQVEPRAHNEVFVDSEATCLQSCVA
ncbi:hypothetical protein Peur_066997 [Populus x canadensis]